MPYAAALSTTQETNSAISEVCEHAQAEFPGSPDLAFVFLSPHHQEGAGDIAAAIQERLAVRCVLGCTGEAIAGNDREVEDGPALSLWLGSWPRGVELAPFRLELEQTPDGYSLLGWPDALMQANPEQDAVLLLADPFTFPIDTFLNRMNEDHNKLRVMGGMASGGREPGQSRLILGAQALDSGAVGVVVQGPVTIRSIVSQGCRPIGQHMVITRAHENFIHELGGQAPLSRLRQLWDELSARDQKLFQQGVHVGRVINEYQGEFQRGDFLVRNVMGIDRESGALAITDRVRVGQTVQFHVRDAQTADEDLRALLQMGMIAHERPPAGALLFTCNGRGTRLFDTANHDASTVRTEAGDIPLAGFFAQGELGPVGGQNFIHGFTASVVLFE